MRPRGHKFTFPLSDEQRKIFDRETNIVVVSVFGKSEYNAYGCKADKIDELLGYNIFASKNPPPLDEATLCLIEGYYDNSTHTVYLHLRSALDGYHFKEAHTHVSERLNTQTFQAIHPELLYRYARALMFLFSVSHILILSHPTAVLDVVYLKIFRTLEAVRQKTSSYMSELLREIPGISKDWVHHMRPCTPRLLFLFETCPKLVMDSTLQDMTKELPENHKLSIKKMEHSIEDHIYRIFRRMRIVTNICSNSYFAIPANQEFVHAQLQQLGYRDEAATLMKLLVNYCNGVPDIHAPTCTEYQARPVHSFKYFLNEHLDLARTKGFDDNIGRHAPPSSFELPSANIWFYASTVMYNGILLDPVDLKLKQVMTQLHNAFDASVRFSDARCKKVIPIATAAYQENLPPHYTKAYHEGKLAHAVSVLIQHARGPLCQQYIEQLQQDCERYWKSNHQMCEVLSLTGNPCTNPLHRAIEEEEPCKEALTRERAPTMPHSSGVRYVSACNCGRKQGPREDPFVLRTANCDFYAALSTDCCESLEHRSFPVFQPSVKDFRAARLFPVAPEMIGSRRESLRGDTGATTTLATQGNTQQGLSLGAFLSGQSGGSEIGTEEVTRLCTNILPSKEEINFPDVHQEIVIRVTDTDRETTREKCLVRQPSTTEYLPGMPHTESPPGLLPQFPSWSLICLGPSSLYSHNHGLTDQPGFLPGTGYLLPWDVTVRLEPSVDQNTNYSDIKWPVLGDTSVSPGQPRKQSNIKSRKSKIGKDQSEFVVKIFIGTEYECPRGHRFMCSTPDRVLKASGTGLVKETGVRVAASDMPLYFQCPCRNTKPLVAQLMRIHVVTPKAPVHVTLNPKVQPAPEPCPTFIPGLQEPMRLSQSAYWVLRLPYIYVGEQGPFSAPKEHVPFNYGRLLSGVYGISELLGR